MKKCCWTCSHFKGGATLLLSKAPENMRVWLDFNSDMTEFELDCGMGAVIKTVGIGLFEFSCKDYTQNELLKVEVQR